MKKKEAYDPNHYLPTYTKEASVYDEIRYGKGYGRLQMKGIYHALDYFLQVKPDTKVLDVATGTGVASLYVAKKGGSITALDLTEAMLNEAKKKAVIENIKNVEFKVGSAFNLPFEDESFDIVTSIKFMHLFPFKQQQAAIREMLRVLKPGGCLVIEFKNILYGVFLRIILKYVLRREEGHCFIPFLTKSLFADGKITNIIGYYVPSQRRLPQSPVIDNFLQNCGHWWPFKWFYDKLYIRCVKMK